jgi:hypothetical protein
MSSGFIWEGGDGHERLVSAGLSELRHGPHALGCDIKFIVRLHGESATQGGTPESGNWNRSLRQRSQDYAIHLGTLEGSAYVLSPFGHAKTSLVWAVAS